MPGSPAAYGAEDEVTPPVTRRLQASFTRVEKNLNVDTPTCSSFLLGTLNESH